ncbi:MAG: DUF2911 domain-containing protein [Cytophagales bacterium]|nr:DUF2911 domain-containing protein [Bernardetiaceae bacterium]MDW8211343.1 DUF2911 domain-containing protein [Cytophagales bacterium]
MKNFCLGVVVFLGLACSPTAKEKQGQTAEASQKTQYVPERELKYVEYAEDVNAGKIPVDTLKTSARREASGKVGNVEVKINYGSPGVRGRVIWNGLVAYDQVWVTGAHTATRVDFSHPVIIGNKEIPAGAYGFFSIPSASEWTLILNRNYDQHLTDNYKESEDVVRIQVKPVEHPIVQRLTYSVEKISDKEGAIAVCWEKIKVAMPFRVKE